MTNRSVYDCQHKRFFNRFVGLFHLSTTPFQQPTVKPSYQQQSSHLFFDGAGERKDFENFEHVCDVQKRLKAYNCRLSSEDNAADQAGRGGIVKLYEVFLGGCGCCFFFGQRLLLLAVGHDLGKELCTDCLPEEASLCSERANLISVTEISFALKCTAVGQLSCHAPQRSAPATRGCQSVRGHFLGRRCLH